MVAARTGSLGVADTTGDLYVVDTNGNLERVPVGANGQVLIADAAAVGPSGSVIGVKWENPSFLAKDSFQCDAVDAIFQKIDLGAGVIANPTPKVRGTHSVLEFANNVLRGIPWQKHMPQGYAGGDLRATVSWVSDGVNTGEVLWSIAFERDNSGFDIDADGFGTVTPFPVSNGPGVAGQIVEATVVVPAADLDGALAGEPLRVFLQKLAQVSPPGLTDKALLVCLVVEEV